MHYISIYSLLLFNGKSLPVSMDLCQQSSLVIAIKPTTENHHKRAT